MERDTHVTLPPGQHAIDDFPRFGTHLHRPPPAVPSKPELHVAGAVAEPFTVPLEDLAKLPRTERTADFHCVAGWSATGLTWEGVAFTTFYRELIEPRIDPDTTITHVSFGGLDGYYADIQIEDALADDVLIAEHLNGVPLDTDHGAPARLVSPSQYGFMNTKHLCRIEPLTEAPKARFGDGPLLSQVSFRTVLVRRHPRARVWEEERNPVVPPWALKPVYRGLTPLIRTLSARGSRDAG